MTASTEIARNRSCVVEQSLDLDEVFAPEKPTNLEETGLTTHAVASLILKWLHGGETSGLELADRVALSYAVLEPIIEHLRVEQFVQVKTAMGTGTAGYRYALTDSGRDRAQRHVEACGYIGPAPVPLDQYASYMAVLRSRQNRVDRDRVAAGFSHLVIEPEMLDQLGPAISSRRAIFLYGPPGNGKSVMGEAIGRVLGGDIYMPNAIDVDGHVIALFDPVTHQKQDSEDESSIIRSETAIDGRWVRVRRPVITVGGELSLDMLHLKFNELSAFYEAPVQLKANGGVLVVDDFGRQHVAARDLLNRWIVPLEARVDYLNLTTGRKFHVPFDVMIVFATNLEPGSLADEAFLRRIPYKVFARNPTNEQFARIFEMNCRRWGLAFNPAHVRHLRERYYQGRKLQMRACHPRDLIDQVVSLCQYHQREPVITTELLDAVCQSYFLHDGQQTGSTAAR